MRRKRLQEFANNLCQMLTARLNEDLEFLAELPDGVLEIDLLNGQAQHGHAGPISLHITDELKAWLHDQLNKSKLILGIKELICERSKGAIS
jgi:hypothetical protein